MEKFVLTTEEIQNLISESTYSVPAEQKMRSRCIEGLYPRDVNLPGMALPGGDIGELAIIYASAMKYGFEVDADKVYSVLEEIVGGPKQFSLHTDEYGSKESSVAGGCTHVKQLRADPEAYDLAPPYLKILESQIAKMKENGAEETVLRGYHQESAFLMVSGPFGIFPQYTLLNDIGKREVQVFIFQKTFVDARHKILAEKLIESKAVTLLPGCDAEYLYDVFSDTTDEHVLESARRVATGLSLFYVTFNEDKTFTLEHEGLV